MTNATPTDGSRSTGAALAAQIEQDKAHRGKGRSLTSLFKLWPFVAKYPGQIIAFLTFLTLSAAASLVLPLILKLIVDCGFGDNPADNPMCARVPVDINAGLDGYFGLVIIFAVFFAMFGALRFFFITRLGQRVVADIRKAVFDKLTTLSPGYFERVRTGEILSRLTTDTTLVETVMTGSISFALRSIATILGSIIMMFIVSWKLAAMVLAIVPIIVLPLITQGKRIRRLSRSGQDELAKASARAGEALSAIQTVQAFTREAYERRFFAVAIEDSYTAQRKRITVQALLTAIMMVMTLGGLTGILWFGARSVEAGSMSGGDIVAFAGYALFAVGGMSSMTETITNLLRAAGAADRLVEILDETPEITGGVVATEKPPAGHILFEAVDFAYPSRQDKPALHNISFEVKPGETIALVGPSGAGKTTIFQALLRFYDVRAGQIKIDGMDIRDLTPEDLRAQMAVVQQGAPLFSGSALDNIGYGRPGASEPDIIEAAKAAYADDFIRALPDGYATDLGERGTTLSGGQRQRIAIARAILRDAPILLLDEATSALDSESEQAVQKAFETMREGRTTLVIAHRLSTVLKADRILVLEDGQIVETGTHKTLMAQSGLYARLADIQFDQNLSN